MSKKGGLEKRNQNDRRGRKFIQHESDVPHESGVSTEMVA